MTQAELELVLTQAYREEEAHYRRALTLTQTSTTTAWLPELQALISQLGMIESRIASARAAWQKLDVTAGPELQGLLQRIAKLLENLGLALQQQTQRVEARKEELLPEIEQFMRFQQMQQAYGKVARAYGS